MRNDQNDAAAAGGDGEQQRELELRARRRLAMQRLERGARFDSVACQEAAGCEDRLKFQNDTLVPPTYTPRALFLQLMELKAAHMTLVQLLREAGVITTNAYLELLCQQLEEGLTNYEAYLGRSIPE